MKRSIVLVSFLLAVGLLISALQGCKGPAGPTGADGKDGTSTILQLEGFKAGIKCGDCHNTDTDTTYYVWAKKYQWELSKHFFGGDFERNQTPCAGCHTTEGFVERMLAGNPPQTAWTGVVNSHVDASPPGCFACHSPHSNGDFALRTTSPAPIMMGVTGVNDATFDFGKGNLCAQCHQPRSMSSPKPDPTKTAVTDTITINSNRWYQHYGVQPQILMGVGGFQFTGYTYTGNSNHSTNTTIKQQGCPTCHMADATAGSGIAGGHTMNISYLNTSAAQAFLLTGCTQSGCHNATGFTIDYIGAASSLTGGLGSHTAVAAYLDTLQTMLSDTAVTKKWMVGTPKPWIVVASDGVTINATSGSPLKIRPASTSGALFNFLLVEHDKSEGSHNTRYVVELLKSSIAELRK